MHIGCCYMPPPLICTTHEQLSARVLTLQEQGGLDTSVGSLDTSGGNLEDKSTEQLWEIIR